MVQKTWGSSLSDADAPRGDGASRIASDFATRHDRKLTLGPNGPGTVPQTSSPFTSASRGTGSVAPYVYVGCPLALRTTAFGMATCLQQ